MKIVALVLFLSLSIQLHCMHKSVTSVFYITLSLSFSVLQSNPELAEAIIQNTRRYITIFSDAISELLPTYKQKEVSKKKLSFREL